MKIEIDQSGKIEDTAKDTVLCLSNKTWHAVVIPSTVKRQLQERFRRHGQIRNFILFTFCSGLVELFRISKPKTKVIIDREYMGKEPAITNIINKMFKNTKSLPVFEFWSIGKHSNAHKFANKVAVKEEKPTLVLCEKAVLKNIKRTEVGKRLKNA